MSPTDGLLAGIVCLPTCPAGPLRDAVFIVVGNLDMKAWISRGTGYYTIFPFQGPTIFWLSCQCCRGKIVGPVRAQEKSPPFENRKLITFPMLCREWHWWREEAEDRRRKQPEDRAEESPSEPAGKAAKCLTCAHTVFIVLNLGTREIKDRRTLTRLATATGVQRTVGPWGHAGE